MPTIPLFLVLSTYSLLHYPAVLLKTIKTALTPSSPASTASEPTPTHHIIIRRKGPRQCQKPESLDSSFEGRFPVTVTPATATICASPRAVATSALPKILAKARIKKTEVKSSTDSSTVTDRLSTTATKDSSSLKICPSLNSSEDTASTTLQPSSTPNISSTAAITVSSLADTTNRKQSTMPFLSSLFKAKAPAPGGTDKNSHLPLGKLGLAAKYTLRFLQFILATVTIFLYASYLTPQYAVAFATDSGMTELCIYLSLTICSLSILAVAIYILPLKITAYKFFALDVFLSLMWLSIFGVWHLREQRNLKNTMLAGLFKTELGAQIDEGRMHNARNLDAAQATFWAISGIAGGIFFVRSRKEAMIKGSSA